MYSEVCNVCNHIKIIEPAHKLKKDTDLSGKCIASGAISPQNYPVKGHETRTII